MYYIGKNTVSKVPVYSKAKTGKKIALFFTDVRPTVTTPVILVQKIQTYTFLDAKFAKKYVGQVYFYNENLQHS